MNVRAIILPNMSCSKIGSPSIVKAKAKDVRSHALRALNSCLGELFQDSYSAGGNVQLSGSKRKFFSSRSDELDNLNDAILVFVVIITECAVSK